MVFKEISPSEAKRLIDENKAVLVDVREPAEHASKRIENAKLHPLGSIKASDIEHQQQALVIYCQKGARGKKACEKLIAQHPELELYNITGGIESWEQSGLATETGKSKVLPLDRQVQITIGSLVLLFCLLSLSVSTAFIWAAMFIGAGLVFAGISGFCGMARIVAMMPWNQKV